MFNIHPQTYSFLYYHFILLMVMLTVFRLLSGNYRGSVKSTGTFIFALIILFVIGLRPYNVPGVGTYFGDTINYYDSFMYIVDGNYNREYKDIGFGLFTNFSARYLNAGAYFFILSALYVLPAYYACKRLSWNYTFLLFLMFATSFLFWANGVNGIRSGIGTSFLLLAFTYKDKKWVMLLFFALALIIHKSMLLPILAFILSFFYSNSKDYIVVWFSSIVLSLLFGGFWESFFAGFDVGDERLSSYLSTNADANVFAYTGFRWDFIFYSAIPIALGAHYIFKKKYTDKFYIQLFNTYLLANSFWILVIRSSFSNRFASLSWFLIPIIILLPLVKIKIWQKQKTKIGLILFLSFAFTYFMSLNTIW
ncbi:EpsG family protein [Ancylomarina sp. YFZ004]